MANNNLTPESQAAFELSVYLCAYLKEWQRETGYSAEDFKEAVDWIDNYFKAHPITEQNENIYLLTMAAAAYHEGKERGAQECRNQ